MHSILAWARGLVGFMLSDSLPHEERCQREDENKSGSDLDEYILAYRLYGNPSHKWTSQNELQDIPQVLKWPDALLAHAAQMGTCSNEQGVSANCVLSEKN